MVSVELICVNIQLNGDNDESIKTCLPKAWFYGEGNTSELYNFICEQFPRNHWVDMCCESVNKVSESPLILEVNIQVTDTQSIDESEPDNVYNKKRKRVE